MDQAVERTTRLLRATRGVAPAAIAPLVESLYRDLRAFAAARLRREPRDASLDATALVHEAWLRLVDQREVDMNDRACFLAAAAVAMQRVLVDHARRRRARKRDAGGRRVTLSAGVSLGGPGNTDVLALDEALQQLALVHARPAQIVALRFFAGITVAEAAHALGVSARTIKADFAFGCAWLKRRLGGTHGA